MPHKDPEAARAYHLAYRTTHKASISASKKANRAKYSIKEKAYKAAHRAEIAAKKKAYIAAHRAKTAITQKAYKEAHKEEAALKRRIRDAANRAKINAQKRAHYAARPAYRAKIQAQSHARYVANPEDFRTYSRSRRARLRNAPINDLTAAQWLEIQAAQDHRCWYCGKRCKGKLSQDHIQPLSKGGSHTLHNVIGACKPCNSSKHTREAPLPVQPLLLTIAPAKKGK